MTMPDLPPLPPIRELGEYHTSWPDPDSCSHMYDRVDREEHRYYRTPDGVFPGVTTVLKVLGLSREALMGWAVGLEREAVLSAAEAEAVLAAAEAEARDPSGLKQASYFRAAVESRLGAERAHQIALTKAGNIGTQVHRRIQWFLARETGQEAGECPIISDQAARGYLSFTDWWSRAGLKPIRVEQPVWHAELGYAGTIDLIAEDSEGNLDVYDYKSGKGIYLEHHLQNRAYVEAARLWAPVRGGKLIRLPKTADEVFDPNRDIEPLGEWRYSEKVWGKKRTFSEDKLMAAFRATLIAWSLLRRRPDFAP